MNLHNAMILDLFCGAGGCSKGYMDGGYQVIGIDIEPMPHYIDPDNFYQGSALNVLDTFMMGGSLADAIPGAPALYPEDFAAIHASPPCQGYSATQRMHPDKEYPKLIEPVRFALRALERPYIMENVETAPLYATVTLCGGMFPELRTYRHRIFETSFPVPQPVHQPHLVKQVKMGRVPEEGDFVQVIGHFPAINYHRKAMGIDWMPRDELAEAIPPHYTEYISNYIA